MPLNKNDVKERKEFLKCKYLKDGINSMTDDEILELMLIFSGNDGTKSETLKNYFGNLTSVFNADKNYLSEIAQLDEKSVVLLKLIPEISKIYAIESRKICRLTDTTIAKQYFMDYFMGFVSENFAVACVDKSMRITSISTIFTGTPEKIIGETREIIDFAMKNSCNSIFIAHNHPFGSAEPSHSDYASTNKLSLALKEFGIMIEDHIVTGRNDAISMRELPYTLQFKEYDNSKNYKINKNAEIQPNF